MRSRRGGVFIEVEMTDWRTLLDLRQLNVPIANDESAALIFTQVAHKRGSWSFSGFRNRR